jgi:glycerol-3-phosphate dehydrogenase
MPGADSLGTGGDDADATDADGDTHNGPVIRPSRGTHITLRSEDFPLTGAALVMPAGEGRNIFALPWMGRTLVGTTDNDYEAGDLSHVPSSEEDVEYLLDAVNEYLGKDLKPSDLTGAYAGVRPLISKADAKKSADISRKAELYQSDNGLITITGGKLTTWRPMAESAVDVIVAREKREAPARTEEIPLGQPMRREDIPDFADIDEDTRHLLVLRYGSFATQVAMLARADERLAQRIVPEMPDRLAEVAIAARSEQARSIGDVLLRRTRLGLLCARDLISATGPTPAVERVADVMAQELGWDDGRRAAESEAWSREARAEGILVG